MSRAAQCLILACGNTLRGDDGLGPHLCVWAEERFCAEPAVRCISRQQWTPDLAESIADADTVLFLDCTLASAPGLVQLAEVTPAPSAPGLATHHLGAAQLLDLAQNLYGAKPRNALQLTIGAGSIALGERFSPAVAAALLEARRLIEQAIAGALAAVAENPVHEPLYGERKNLRAVSARDVLGPASIARR
jgi:hydrogenase maturation protease